MRLSLTVNGERREVEVAPLKRLLDVLREDLGLTGTKEGCGEGECGACAVIADGAPVNACLVPACQAEGAAITTVEGLTATGPGGPEAPIDGLTPLQRCFLEQGGAQCGICTPGMLIASACWMEAGRPATEASAREAIAGNLCRCTGYTRIVEAMLAARREADR